MTNEEAIKDIEENILPVVGGKSLRMAIDALKAQTDGDTISRQAAIDAILAMTGNSSVRELYEHVQEHRLSEMWSGGVIAAIDIIIAVPSAQPERKTGTWIYIRTEEDGNALYECSVCHKGETHVPIVEVSYCWNCGADMRGEQND